MRLMLASFECNKELTLDQMLHSKYCLMSFYNLTNNKKIMQVLNNKNQNDAFLLDSGAFTLFSSNNTNVDFDDYLYKYIHFINKYDIKRFIELDIDVIVGYPKVLRMRKILEKETGKQCIPVWHKSRGMQAYKDIVAEYKYICIGGLGNKEITQKEYPKVKKMVAYANAHQTNVHGLAFTRKDAFNYGFYSVDSSSWSTGVRFGQAHKFSNGQIVSTTRKEGQRANEQKIRLNNYLEWLKFQRYVDRKGKR